MAKIQLKQVSFCYGEGAGQVKALDGVDLSVEEGEFVCVIGRSGCGKSTLLRLLSGLQRPSGGQVLVDGREVTEPATSTAMVFQNDSLFPWMRVLENVSFGVRQAQPKRSRAEAKAIAEAYLAKVEMADCARMYPNQLSGGMKQRVAIARALAMEADILLMDEPFGALDARTRQSLRRLLESLWLSGEKRKTVVMVTHDIREAAIMADKILFMIPGRIDTVISSDLPRPRNPIDPAFTGLLEDLQRELTQLFYRDGEEAEV